jgi:hypothetical protein
MFTATFPMSVITECSPGMLDRILNTLRKSRLSRSIQLVV